MQTNTSIKKIIGIISVLLPMMFIASCEEEYKPETVESSIKIVSNNLLFGPSGGTGTVEFESAEAVKAYSEQPWCEVSVEGNKVLVKALEYGELENRYSSIILEAGNSSVRVVAQQNGVIMNTDVKDNYLLTDDSSEIRFTITSNADVTLSTSAEWIECTKSGDEVVVKISENVTGHIRTGWVNCSSGQSSKKVTLSQASAKDLYGKYKLYGYSANNQLVYLPVTISAGSGENDMIISCEGATYSWKFSAAFVPETHTLTLANGQYVGGFAIGEVNFYVYLCTLSKSTGTFSWDKEQTLSASVLYDNEKGCTVIGVKPETESSASGVVSYDSLIFAGFMNQDAETGGPKGAPSTYPAILYTPYFQSY
ncbi:MAG: hypothetical protein E7121_07760 [Bacteroidales bacterium]|nr:hypothetical protein [Bacteroidales bacterium]